MLSGDRKAFSQLKYEMQNTSFFQPASSKNAITHPNFISKKPEEENNLIDQYIKNDIGYKKNEEKKFNHTKQKADFIVKKQDYNKQDVEIVENLEENENSPSKDELEVKYIVINNKNINLGMSTKLQSKINKIKGNKKKSKKEKIKFIAKKNIFLNQILIF